MLQKNLAIIRKPAPQMMLQLLRHCPFSVNYIWLSIKRWQIKSSGCWQSEEYELQIFPKICGRFKSGKVSWIHFPAEIFREWKIQFFSSRKSTWQIQMYVCYHPRITQKHDFLLHVIFLPFLVFISRKFVSSTSALPHVPKILPAWQNFCGLDFCAESEAFYSHLF